MEPMPILRKKKGKKSKIQHVIEQYEAEIRDLELQIEVRKSTIVKLKDFE